jgi:hypothetical protein
MMHNVCYIQLLLVPVVLCLDGAMRLRPDCVRPIADARTPQLAFGRSFPGRILKPFVQWQSTLEKVPAAELRFSTRSCGSASKKFQHGLASWCKSVTSLVTSASAMSLCLASTGIFIGWWRPWKVPALQGRYLTLKLLLLRVQCRKTCYLSLLRLKYAAKAVALYAKWSKPLLHLHYLLLNRFIVHKFQKARMTPDVES